MVGPFLTNNLIGGVGIYLNLVNSKDQLNIKKVGVYSDSVSSNG